MKSLNLFSVPIFHHNISIDQSKALSVLQSLNWDDNNPLSSDDKNLLHGPFSYLVDDIKRFSDYSMEEMGFGGVKYIFSTSWATRVLPKQSSLMHKHTNVFLSGVLYFSHNSSPIVFTNPFDISYNHFHSKWNCFSSKVTPKMGDIIIFPSSVYHQISVNESNNTRYSLAFNILPIGHYGKGDSEIFCRGLTGG